MIIFYLFLSPDIRAAWDEKRKGGKKVHSKVVKLVNFKRLNYNIYIFIYLLFFIKIFFNA